MDTKNPKSFMAAKLSARAVETSNMKNAQVFNISYTPGEILIRSELEGVTDDLADYVNLGLPRHIIIYGSKGSGRRSVPSSWQRLSGTRNPSRTSMLT